MNIAENIQRINEGKASIKTLCSQKNINIPSTTKIDGYASIIGQNWPDYTYGVSYDGTKIRGSTKKYNQLIVKETYSNGGITFNPTSVGVHIYGTATTGSYWNNVILGFSNCKSGHKYLIPAIITIPNATIQATIYSSTIRNIVFNDVDKIIDGLDGSFEVGIQVKNGATIDAYVNLMCIDITEIYGAGNEPTSVTQFLSDYPEFNNYVKFSSGSLFNGYYKGILLRQYDYIETTDNTLHIGSGYVDLDSLNWIIGWADSPYVKASDDLVNLAKRVDYDTDIGNIISEKYKTVSLISTYENRNTITNSISIRTNGYIYVNNDGTTPTGFLVYELLTPKIISL